MRRYLVYSLFSGIGMIDYAFEKAGFTIGMQVENDPFCQRVLAKHWPNVERHGDIRTFAPDATCDVLAGGFPCQDISGAGRKAGIKEGTRSGLWFEFARLIGVLRPRYVFIENVPAITTNGGTTVIESLTALGYDARWHVVAASDAGAPHERERWFCVAYANRIEPERGRATGSLAGAEKTPEGSEEERQRLRDTAGEGSADVAYAGSFDGRRNDGLEQGRQSAGAGCDMEDAERGGLEVPRKDLEPVNPETHSNGSANRIKHAGIGIHTKQGFETTQSRLGGIFDGLPARLDAVRRTSRWPSRPGEAQFLWEPPRTTGSQRDRASRLKALGNSVVWQVVYPFAQGIWEALVLEDSQTEVD